MAIITLFFLVIAIISAFLGLTKILSLSIIIPVMFICLACAMFVSAQEHKKKYDKNKTVTFMLLGMFFVVVTAYSLLSNL